MNEDKFIRLNTAFKLTKNVAGQAIALSCEISQNNEAVFVLDGVQFHPHITIYSPEYPKSNTEKVLEIVEEIANNNAKIKFKFKKISSGQGFISLNFDYSPEIKKFHEESVQKLNPLRKKHIRKKYQEGSNYHMEFSPEQKENIKKYGYPDAMNLYFPHLTITRLKDESSTKRISENINWSVPQFIVDKIAVYKMREHGTCGELVKEFNLK